MTCSGCVRKRIITFYFETGDNVQHFSIAPLLLIAFVENAFKHVSHYTDKDNNIQVQLHRQNGCMLFDVINTKNNNHLNNDRWNRAEKCKTKIGIVV